MISTQESIKLIKTTLGEKSNNILERLSLLTITWNVNSRIEDIVNLTDLFDCPINNVINMDTQSDLIVIGIQEIIELSATNVVSSEFTGMTIERVNKWTENILGTLNNRESNEFEYHCVKSVHMVGLWLAIFTKDYLISYLNNIQTAYLARGAGGILGNKGAVYISMNIQDTSICFINSHFTAHREKFKKRNTDYNNIVSTNIFHHNILSKTNLKTLISEPLLNNAKDNLLVTNLKQQNSDLRKKINTFSVIINKEENKINEKLLYDDITTEYSQNRISSLIRKKSDETNDLYNNNNDLLNITAEDIDDEIDSDDDTQLQPSSSFVKSNTTSSANNNSTMNEKMKLKKSILEETFDYSADEHDVIIFLGNYHIIYSFTLKSSYCLESNQYYFH